MKSELERACKRAERLSIDIALVKRVVSLIENVGGAFSDRQRQLLHLGENTIWGLGSAVEDETVLKNWRAFLAMYLDSYL